MSKAEEPLLRFEESTWDSSVIKGPSSSAPLETTRQDVNEIPSLDGWRAVAVLIVFASHAGLGRILPGGFGVTIFFFLSGYLITTLLLKEFQKNNTISITRFYGRRFLRLMPPLAITVIISFSLTNAGLLQGGATLAGFFSQLFYFANYYNLFFDPNNLTTPTGTMVLWSLAIEEHFYLAYPAILLFLLSRSSRMWVLAFCVTTCAIVLLWRMNLASQSGFHVSRTYFATDTRIDSIMYGCILALCWAPKPTLPHEKIKAWEIALVLMGFMTLIFTLIERSTFFRETFRYSLQGIALFPLFLYSIKYPHWSIFKLLNTETMKKIGVYSYAIYLAHLVILINLNDYIDGMFFVAVIGAILSLTFAAILDRFVDGPLRIVRARLR